MGGQRKGAGPESCLHSLSISILNQPGFVIFRRFLEGPGI